MNFHQTSIKVVELACQRGHPLSRKDLETGLGRCRCREERFTVTLERTILTLEHDPDLKGGAVLGGAALDLLSGGALNVGSSAGVQKSEVTLRGIPGRELLARLKGPVEEALEWIQEVRLTQARENLRPDQKICAGCGSIFSPPRHAAVKDDYCSPRCRSDAAPKAADPSPPPAMVDLICPNCGNVLTLRSSVLGRIVSCPGCAKKFIPQG